MASVEQPENEGPITGVDLRHQTYNSGVSVEEYDDLSTVPPGPPEPTPAPTPTVETKIPVEPDSPKERLRLGQMAAMGSVVSSNWLAERLRPVDRLHERARAGMGNIAVRGSVVVNRFLESRLDSAWSKSRGKVDTLYQEAAGAKHAGLSEMVSERVSDIGGLVQDMKVPLSYRLGSRLGFARPVKERRDELQEQYRQGIASVKSVRSKPFELGPVPPPAPPEKEVLSREQQDVKHRLANIESWFNLDNIMELQESIRVAVNKRVKEAHLIGDNYQIGFNRLAVELEVSQQHLERYFGATTAELEAGKKIPQWIQNKVSDFLDMPQKKLERVARANRLVKEAVDKPVPIEAYRDRLPLQDRKDLTHEISEELFFVNRPGLNKKTKFMREILSQIKLSRTSQLWSLGFIEAAYRNFDEERAENINSAYGTSRKPDLKLVIGGKKSSSESSKKSVGKTPEIGPTATRRTTRRKQRRGLGRGPKP